MQCQPEEELTNPNPSRPPSLGVYKRGGPTTQDAPRELSQMVERRPESCSDRRARKESVLIGAAAPYYDDD